MKQNKKSENPEDRRRSLRLNVVHAAKVYDARAERFFSAETCNISATGALLKIQRSMPVNNGDQFEVGILPEPRREELLSLDDMMSSRVVRVTPIDRFSQAVAVQYVMPITIVASLNDPRPQDRSHMPVPVSVSPEGSAKPKIAA